MIWLETFFPELFKAFFYRFEGLVGVHSFSRDRNFGTFSDICRHDVHDAYGGTFLSVRLNGNFTLETHGTAHQFAYRPRMKATLV